MAYSPNKFLNYLVTTDEGKTIIAMPKPVHSFGTADLWVEEDVAESAYELATDLARENGMLMREFRAVNPVTARFYEEQGIIAVNGATGEVL